MSPARGQTARPPHTKARKPRADGLRCSGSALAPGARTHGLVSRVQRVPLDLPQAACAWLGGDAAHGTAGVQVQGVWLARLAAVSGTRDPAASSHRRRLPDRDRQASDRAAGARPLARGDVVDCVGRCWSRGCRGAVLGWQAGAHAGYRAAGRRSSPAGSSSHRECGRTAAAAITARSHPRKPPGAAALAARTARRARASNVATLGCGRARPRDSDCCSPRRAAVSRIARRHLRAIGCGRQGRWSVGWSDSPRAD